MTQHINENLNSFFRLGVHSQIAQGGTISNPSQVAIGSFVHIQTGYHWNLPAAANPREPSLLLEDGCRVDVGLSVSCGPGIQRVHIGRNVQIGPYVSLLGQGAQVSAPKPGVPWWGREASNPEPDRLIVGDGCIIGAHAVIAGPVKIGKFSVIQPNSVVTEDIPGYCIVSGNPAYVTHVFEPESLTWVEVSGQEERDSVLSRRREQPLVSICIPTYNRANHLTNNLNSIYGQIGDDDLIEVIVTDNASTDSTPQICEAFAQKFSSLRYTRNDKNIGGDLNIAYVSTLARGSFIKLNGDDDYWLPGALIDYIGIVLQNLDCTLIHTYAFNNNGQILRLEGCDQFLAYTSNNALSMTMNTMKKSVWDRLEDVNKYAHTHVNHIYWFNEMLILEPKFCFVNRDLYRYAGVAPEGYNVGEVGIKNFMDAIKRYEGTHISGGTIKKELEKRFFQVILPLYEKIIKKGLSSDISDLEAYYSEYYAEEDYYEEGLQKIRQLSALR